MDLKDLIRKWADKARDDLIVAETLFQNTHPKQIYIACYHCQQAVEKMLKCYLVYNNIEPSHIF
jgi:HEPN domain-containing protein